MENIVSVTTQHVIGYQEKFATVSEKSLFHAFYTQGVERSQNHSVQENNHERYRCRSNYLFSVDLGTCNCGNCECNDGWKGKACECTLDTSECFDTSSDAIDSTQPCNGNGECECGVCSCFSGQGGAKVQDPIIVLSQVKVYLTYLNWFLQKCLLN